MNSFPFDRWGKVSATRESGGADAVKVTRAPGGGFLIMTAENGVVYDIWVQTIEEVSEDLGRLKVEWPCD